MSTDLLNDNELAARVKRMKMPPPHRFAWTGELIAATDPPVYDQEPPPHTDDDGPPPEPDGFDSFSEPRAQAPETKGKKPDGPRWRTAAEVGAEEPERVPAIAPYLVAGAITELDAYLKTGKTTFALSMVAAIVRGKPFLGEPTRPTPVIYLNETSTTSLREALGRAGLLDCTDLHILNWTETFRLSWPARVELAREKAREVGAKVLVVDTLSQWAGISGDKENIAGHMMEAMMPLQIAQADGLAILMIRHAGKNPQDVVGKGGRGSSAVSGVADLIVELNRVAGGSTEQRLLRYSGRYGGFQSEMHLDFVAGEYVVQGEQAATKSNDKSILDALPSNEGDAIGVDRLLGDLEKAGRKLGRKATDEILNRMIAAGGVGRLGGGVRGSAFKFWRRDSFLSSRPPMDAGDEKKGSDCDPAERELMSFEEVVEVTIRKVTSDTILPAIRELLAARVQPVPTVYLTTQEAAELAGVRPETIRRWIDGGRLRSHWAGRLIRVSRSELDVFLGRESQMAEAPIDLEKRAREILASRTKVSR